MHLTNLLVCEKNYLVTYNKDWTEYKSPTIISHIPRNGSWVIKFMLSSPLFPTSPFIKYDVFLIFNIESPLITRVKWEKTFNSAVSDLY